MNSKIIGSMIGMLLIVTVIILWPKSRRVPISSDVEAAINSIEPIREVIPANVNDEYHKITLGNWSHLDVQCCILHQEWDDGHISSNKLKRKEDAVIKTNIAIKD